MRAAILSRGRLIIADSTGAAETVESPFARQVQATAQRIAEQQEWKAGTARKLMGLPGAMEAPDMPSAQAAVTAVTRGEEEGCLTYVIDTGAVGGLFDYDIAARREDRVFHREGFGARDLDRCPQTGFMACSERAKDGTSCIVVLDAHGDRRQLTEGDSFDEAPSWIPEAAVPSLVFQSAGVARSAQGFISGIGPWRIERISLAGGDIQTLAESETHDHMLPHMAAGGDLLFLRRPWQRTHKPRWGAVLLDGILFPFRFARALLMFFDVFSRLFSHKPLVTAQGKHADRHDDDALTVRGHVLELRKLADSPPGSDPPGLAPDSWELVRRRSSGGVEVLARGVVSFDVGRDGSVVWTNGTSVFALGSDGSSSRLHKSRSPIEHVVAL